MEKHPWAIWLGMGIGGYQGGIFFGLSGSYVILYANAVAAFADQVLSPEFEAMY